MLTLLLSVFHFQPVAGSQNPTASFAFFDNAGGFLQVNGLEISSTNPEGPIFYNRNGDTAVSNLNVRTSTLNSVSVTIPSTKGTNEGAFRRFSKVSISSL
jgi:hypothetical protein